MTTLIVPSSSPEATNADIFGPNGIQFISPRTILFASTDTSPATGDPTSWGLFKVRVRRDGDEVRSGDYPDDAHSF